MIFTHPYRSPTISGLYEMCAAGGGDSKLYRLRLPLNPHEVVGGCPESLILNHLTFPFKYNSIMTYPIFSIPKPVFPGYCFNRNQPLICKDRLPLCNTGKFSLFPFLPQMPVHTVLFHRHMEHLAC